MWSLRTDEISVLSTDPADIDQLSDPPTDNVRLIVRDVLAKSDRFEEILHLPVWSEQQPEIVRIDEAPDVIIELIPPEPAQALPTSRAQPAP